MFDPTPYRPLFRVTEQYAYFNHASVAGLCVPSLEALQAYMEASSRHALVSEMEWMPHIDGAREKVARLIGATPDEIAWVPNASTGLISVANGVPWQPGDNVVTTAEQFPANLYPWLNLQADEVAVRLVPRRAGGVPLEEIAAAMDARTRLVTVSWVEFDSGFRYDLRALADIVHARGALLCVDAIQGVGGLALDVGASGVDFATASTHKWLLGPLGLGFLYIRADRLEGLRPRLAGWRSVPDPMNTAALDQPWLPSARRFEGGTPNMLGLVAFEPVLDLLLEVGPPVIEGHILALTDHLLARLDDRGYTVLTPREPGTRSGIVSFYPKEETAEATAERLAAQQISVAARGPVVRVAPHFYNTFAEIDRLFAPGVL
jgi:selenocysteine lyase/cysteine desulfurase